MENKFLPISCHCTLKYERIISLIQIFQLKFLLGHDVGEQQEEEMSSIGEFAPAPPYKLKGGSVAQAAPGSPLPWRRSRRTVGALYQPLGSVFTMLPRRYRESAGMLLSDSHSHYTCRLPSTICAAMSTAHHLLHALFPLQYVHVHCLKI